MESNVEQKTTSESETQLKEKIAKLSAELKQAKAANEKEVGKLGVENNALREKLTNSEEMVKKYESAMNDYTLKKMDPKFKELMVKLKNENEAYRNELEKREEEKRMLEEQVVSARVKLADIELYRENSIQPMPSSDSAQQLQSELVKVKKDLGEAIVGKNEQEAKNKKLIELLKKHGIAVPSK